MVSADVRHAICSGDDAGSKHKQRQVIAEIQQQIQH